MMRAAAFTKRMDCIPIIPHEIGPFTNCSSLQAAYLVSSTPHGFSLLQISRF
jgi:hypothetical protein